MRFSRIEVVGLLVLLAGCSGGGQVETERWKKAPPDTVLPALDYISRPHQASAPYEYVTLGRQAHSQSEYSEVSGDVMYMEPAGAGFAWTIYELSTAGHPPLSLRVETGITGGEVYFGISDYTSDAWRFGNPVSTTDVHEVAVGADDVSDANNVYLAVVSTPDSLVTITRVLLTIDQPGWLIYTLDDTDYAGANLEMFIQDLKPMIAYGSDNSGVIRFLRADTSFPTDPGQWTSMAVDTDPDPARLGGPLAAASIDGRPAVAYMETVEDLVKYAYSQVAEPGGTDDWVSMVVADLTPGVSQIGLANLDGSPCLAFGAVTQGLFFAQASTSAPEAGDWVITEVDPPGPEETAGAPSLSVAGGRPVIFCHGSFDAAGGAYYLRAKTATPASPADWDRYLAFGFAPAGYSNSLHIMSVKPSSYRPLASFINDPTIASLIVNVGRIPIPLAPDDWHINYVDHDVGSNDICSSGGKPFVIYSSHDETSIKCAWSQEYEPVNSADWDFYVLQDDTNGSVAAVSISNTPIIAFRDSTNNVLRFGFYDE